MKYVQLDESNAVITVAYSPQEGFIEAPDSVEPGYIYDPVLGTFSPPPPPPLTKADFEDAYFTRLNAHKQAARATHFESTLALVPGYPALPESIAAYNAILDTVVTGWPA